MQTDVITPAPPRARHAPRERSRWETRVAIITVLVFGLALSAVLLFALASNPGPATNISTATTLVPKGPPPYPIGTSEPLEPSGLGPPLPNAMPGYHRTYTTDFSGGALPAGWQTFTGVPGGDPTAHFASSHVVVHGGMLRLNTWHVPNSGYEWTSGGLCQCGHPQTYGAFFVRSRITGAGPNEVQLLWPANNQWPPEIDFNESGVRGNGTSGTLHYGTAKNDVFNQQNLSGIDLLNWNTWGVIWTPNTITYVLNGRQWGTVEHTPGTIPRLPMTLDFQQRPGCSATQVCPPQAQSQYIDWVAEYTHN